MRITQVETLFVRLPLAFRYAGGATVAETGVSREYSGSLLIKLHTDQGFIGLGDVIVKSGKAEEGAAAKRYVDLALAPLLIGADPRTCSGCSTASGPPTCTRAPSTSPASTLRCTTSSENCWAFPSTRCSAAKCVIACPSPGTYRPIAMLTSWFARPRRGRARFSARHQSENRDAVGRGGARAYPGGGR